MPVVFLFVAVRLKLAPLNAVCLALLTSTAFSSGCWAVLDGAKYFKEWFSRQLVIAEQQLKEQEGKNGQAYRIMHANYSKSMQILKSLIPIFLSLQVDYFLKNFI